MGAGFLECDFDLPAGDEPGENVARAGIEIGGEEGLRFEFAFGITNEEPADRHGWQAAAIPDGGSAGDLDDAVGSAVPETDAVALPGDFWIVEDGGELFEALAFDRRPAGAFALGWWESEQVGVEPQSCNDTDVVVHRGEELDGRERGVGNQDDVAIGQPAVDLQGGLAGPID